MPSSLLAVECREAVSRSSHSWAPDYALGGTAAAAWALSAEALDELAEVVVARAWPNVTPPAATEAAVGARPRHVACGLKFADRGAQAAHCVGAHRAAAGAAGGARRAGPTPPTGAPRRPRRRRGRRQRRRRRRRRRRRQRRRRSVVDGNAAADAGGGERRHDARSSTVVLPAGPAACASVCAAVAGACSFGPSAPRPRGTARSSDAARARRGAAPRAAGRRRRRARERPLRRRDLGGDGQLGTARSRGATRRGRGGAQSALDASGKKVSNVGSGCGAPASALADGGARSWPSGAPT